MKRNEFAEYLNSIIPIFVGICKSVNFAEIEKINQVKWEAFIDSKIDNIFEQLAGTTPEGKTEYDAIQ